MWTAFKRGLSRTCRQVRHPVTLAFKLNDDAIAARKALCNTGGSFVSTHDIICTELFKLCESGMMFAMNLRGRVSNINRNLAGNYEVMCPMSIVKDDSPLDFRTKWNKLLKREAVADEIVNTNMSLSWTTFYHQVELPGAKHKLHLPIYEEAEMVYIVLGVPLCGELTVIIFKMNRKETGAVIIAYSDVLTEEFFEDSELFEEEIII